MIHNNHWKSSQQPPFSTWNAQKRLRFCSWRSCSRRSMPWTSPRSPNRTRSDGNERLVEFHHGGGERLGVKNGGWNCPGGSPEKSLEVMFRPEMTRLSGHQSMKHCGPTMEDGNWLSKIKKLNLGVKIWDSLTSSPCVLEGFNHKDLGKEMGMINITRLVKSVNGTAVGHLDCYRRKSLISVGPSSPTSLMFDMLNDW